MRARFLFLFITFAGTAWGQSAPDRKEPLFRTGGAFFALSVADITASTAWYVEKLSLRVVMQTPRTDATRAAATVLQGGGLTVELIQRDNAVSLRSLRPAAPEPSGIHGIFKVGFTVDDFDRTLAALRARGVEIAYGPWPKRTDQPANVIVRDNAGTLIQIFGK